VGRRVLITAWCFLLWPCLLFQAAESAALKLSSREAAVIRKARKLAETDGAAAESLLREFLTSKESPAVLAELATLRAESGNVAGAIAVFKRVTELSPSFPGAFKNLGKLLARSRRWDEAVSALRRGIETEGPDVGSCTVLGQCLLLLEKYVAAETALRYALMVKGDDPDLLFALARSCLGQKRYREGETAVLAALKRRSAWPEAWILLARARVEDGREEEAIDAIEAARFLGLELEPRVVWTLGDLYFASGLKRQAAVVYREVVRKGEAEPRRLGNAALSFLASGDFEEAVFLASQLLKRDSGNAAAWEVIGEAALGKNEFDRAKEAFRHAVEADPLSGRALLRLGELAARGKKYAEAMSYFRSTQTIERFEEAAFRAQAALLLRTGRLEEALGILEKLNRKYPSERWSALISEIERRLSEGFPASGPGG